MNHDVSSDDETSEELLNSLKTTVFAPHQPITEENELKFPPVKKWIWYHTALTFTADYRNATAMFCCVPGIFLCFPRFHFALDDRNCDDTLPLLDELNDTNILYPVGLIFFTVPTKQFEWTLWGAFSPLLFANLFSTWQPSNSRSSPALTSVRAPILSVWRGVTENFRTNSSFHNVKTCLL